MTLWTQAKNKVILIFAIWLFLLLLEAKADTALFPNSTSHNVSTSQPHVANSTTSLSTSTLSNISVTTTQPSAQPEQLCSFDEFKYLSYIDQIYFGRSCVDILTSSICAWQNSQTIRGGFLGAVTQATSLRFSSETITGGGSSESPMMTVYSVLIYEYTQTFFIGNTDFPSSTTNTLTLTPTTIAKLVPGENCCDDCSVWGSDARVYHWPTPAPGPPVSELVNSVGYTL
jgi:hypothetical protein